MEPAPLSDRPPRLAAMDGPLRGYVFDLDGGPWSIGRGAGNRLVVDDPSLSRRHCMVEYRDNAIWLRDLESHNGTFVNCVPVREHLLCEGDEIKAGNSVFRFLTADSTASPNLPSVRFDVSAIENPTVLFLHSQDSIYLQPGEALAAAARTAGAVERYQALLRLASALHASGGTEALAQRLLAVLLESIPAQRAAILLFRDGDEEPLLACTRDRAAGAGAPVDANRAAVDRAFREELSVLSGGAFLAAPLINRQKLLGVIYLDAYSGGEQLNSDHLQFAAAAGVLCGPALADALEFGRIEEENRQLREEVRIRHEMVGESPRMQEVYRLVARVAPADSTVLILGETGTGKELVARAIHRNSPREKGPFVAINCAALTETLLESELFGHERGAFTGAVAQKKGKLEMADRGTLFLDEIGELPAALQTKLLRALQEREFERVGGTRPIRVDIRILAATNRDLRAAAAKGAFRDDLYYRLNVVTVKLPALRDRRDDIPLLASYFLSRFAGARRVSGISSAARGCLTAYDWPGNVRELQHAIESAVVLGNGDLILPEDLPETVLDAAPTAEGAGANQYRGALQHQKSELILAALEQSGGSVTEAARQLGLHPNYLHRLIRNLGLRSRMKTSRAPAKC
jgi:transcriptional regulator with GAF, ATPase, and Fis domain